MCMLWSTSKKRPSWLKIAPAGLPPMYFRLKWGAFVEHCFKRSQLGHFLADCMQPNADMHVNLSNGDNNVSQQMCNGSDVNMDVPGHPSSHGQVPILAMHDNKGKHPMPPDEGQWQHVVSKTSHTSERKDAEHVGSQALKANPPRTYARHSAQYQAQMGGPNSAHYKLRSRSSRPIQPSSTLHFDKRGKVVTPWDCRYKELASTS
ncbi:hypothetical protein L7F22_059753 [Adiantum nelumboides]|nr:hypothetical protein [Adiantum nelumboides]